MSTGATNPGSIRRAFRIVSPTCEDMSELISAMLDRELPLRTRLRMRLHFLYCRYCRRVREQLQFVHRAASLLDTAEGREPDEGLDAADREKLRRALKEQR